MAELPPTAEFVRIEGAIHSYFGDYGEQRGDGTPTLSRQAAQDQIAGTLGIDKNLVRVHVTSAMRDLVTSRIPGQPTWNLGSCLEAVARSERRKPPPAS